MGKPSVHCRLQFYGDIIGSQLRLHNDIDICLTHTVEPETVLTPCTEFIIDVQVCVLRIACSKGGNCVKFGSMLRSYAT